MGTDRCAYLSKLRKVDPVPKLWFTLATLLLCVLADSVLAGLLSPVAGIIVAIAALCRGVRRNGRMGTALAVIAIILPVVITVTTVLLFSTGVIRISLM